MKKSHYIKIAGIALFVVGFGLNFTNQADAAITRRATATGTVSTATNTLTVGKPAGTVDGDLMVAVVCNDTSTHTMSTPPTGWTLIGSRFGNFANSAMSCYAYSRTASAEGASYNWVWSGNMSTTERGAGIIATYYDDTGLLVSLSSVTNTEWTSTTSPQTLNQVTTYIDNAMLVSLVGVDDATSGTCTSNYTSPLGSIVHAGCGGGSMGVALANGLQTVGGASGSKSLSITQNTDGGGILLSLISGSILSRGNATTVNDTSGTVLTLSKPATATTGDFLVAAVCNDNGNAQVNAVPAGWTLVGSRFGNFTTGMSCYTYTKPALQGDSQYDWGWDTSFDTTTSRALGVMGAFYFSNPGGHLEVDTSTVTEFASTTGTQTLTAITTSIVNEVIMGIYAADDPASTCWSTYTSPLIEFSEVGGGSLAVAMATGSAATAGTTGTKSATCSTSSDGGGILLALKPKPATPYVITTGTGGATGPTSFYSGGEFITVADGSYGEVRYGAGAGHAGTACQDLPNTTDGGTYFSTASSYSSVNLQVTGLSPSTLYYFCMYVEDPVRGNYYSPTTSSVTTTAPIVPSITLEDVEPAATTTSVSVRGNITSDGGATITERGVCFSTSDATPSVGEGGAVTCQTTAGTTGAFTVVTSGLSADTFYYYRMYGTNSAGTSYTDLSSFVTALSGAAITGYDYRKELVLDESLLTTTVDLLSLPVLISTTEASLKTVANGGKVTNANGYDIIFGNASGVQLDHEIESYNATTGQIVMWVRIPIFDDDADTSIYVYYGNSGISTSQEDVSGVWKNGYNGVWHLGANLNDSSGNANNGTNQSATTGVAAVAGNGISVTGGQRVTIGNSASLKPTAVTVTMWAYRNGVQQSYAKPFYAGQAGADPYGIYGFQSNNTSDTEFGFQAVGDSAGQNTVRYGSQMSNDTTWYHLAGSYSPGNVNFHLNGAAPSSQSNSGYALAQNDTNGAAIGGRVTDTSQGFVGSIDEVRIARVARRTIWVQAEYVTTLVANQGAGTGKFIQSVGAEEELDPSPDVTTNAVTSVGKTIATLNATANPKGLASTGWFRYFGSNPGTCADSGGTRVPGASGDALGSGSTGVGYNENITGLTPGTTYYVCALASNSQGTGVGTPVSFTTDEGTPSGVDGSSESDLESYRVTFNGTANPNSFVTTGHFRLFSTNPTNCSSDTGGVRFPALSQNDIALGSGTNPVPFSYTVPLNGASFLVPSTTYWYCSYGINTYGTIGAATVISFTTPDGPNSPCDPPTSGNIDIPAGASCTFDGSFTGVDTGTGTTNTGVLRLASGVNLTISNGQRIGRGSITLNGGQMTLERGATTTRGGVFVRDKDADGIVDDGTKYVGSTSSASTEFVRRNSLSTNYNYAWKLASSSAIFDCNNNSATAWRTVPVPVVVDADNDGYKTSTAQTSTACVGSQSTINGRIYYRDASNNYSYLQASQVLAGGMEDCNDGNASVGLCGVAVVNSGSNSGTGTAVSINTPANALTGDLAVCLLHWNGNASVTDNNAGFDFTQVDLQQAWSETQGDAAVFAWQMTSTPASFAWTLGTSQAWVARCYIVRGHNPENPIHGTNFASALNTATATAPAVSTTLADTLAIAFVGWDNTNLTINDSPDDVGEDWTVTPADQTTPRTGGSAYKEISGTGNDATGTAGWTISVATDDYFAFMIVIEPAVTNIEYLRPNGHGNYLEWATGSYTDVDDDTIPDSDTTYVGYTGGSALQLESYTAENTALTTQTITSVNFCARMRMLATGTPTFRLGYRYSGVDSIGTQQLSGLATGEWYTLCLSRNAPAGGWDTTELNGLEILYGVDANESFRVTQTWAEVSYTP